MNNARYNAQRVHQSGRFVPRTGKNLDIGFQSVTDRCIIEVFFIALSVTILFSVLSVFYFKIFIPYTTSVLLVVVLPIYRYLSLWN
jgi:hypothetical protein